MVFLATGTRISGTNKKPYCTCKWGIKTGTKNCKEEKAYHETTEAAAKIHGSTNEHSSATFDKLFDTLQKRCKLDNLTKYVMGN